MFCSGNAPSSYVQYFQQSNKHFSQIQPRDCIGKNLEFKENHLSILKTMQQVDKNTHVVDRLGTFL